MKEIGGYFEFEKLISNEYYKDLIKLNSARNALLYLIKAKKIKKIFIPYFLCDSIENILKNNDIQFKYYKIDFSFKPIIKEKINESEFLYVVNYYGQISNEEVLNMKHIFKNIILDNTHAFFQKPIKGVDTIYSCRKFFGVPDGAYLYTNKILSYDLVTDISKDRMIHILGRYEGTASGYYNEFQKNDEIFEKEPIKIMSKLTQNLLGAIDYTDAKKIRTENFKYLHKYLKVYNKLNIEFPEGAFSYPLYIEGASKIREKLIKKKIYVSTLWPNVIKSMDTESVEYKLANNILPLPCDQRYDIKDMKFIIDTIKEEINLK